MIKKPHHVVNYIFQVCHIHIDISSTGYFDHVILVENIANETILGVDGIGIRYGKLCFVFVIYHG